MNVAVALPIVLKLLELSAYALQRLPERNAQREAALEKVAGMVRAGEQPTEADFQAAFDAIDAAAAERENILAMKRAQEAAAAAERR